MSGIFGGSKQKSQQQSTQESGNRAYGYAQQTFDPMVQLGNKAGSFIGNLLGLGDTEAGNAAFNDYKNSTGFQSTIDSGVNAIRQAGLNSGTFNSGRTQKRLMEFGQETNQKYLDNFLTRLFGLTGQGADAGKSIIGAGQYSTGQSSGTSSGSSNNGMGGFLGGLMASDPRLKTNVEYLGEQNGLNVYRYNYIWDDETRHVGYMADEIAESHPEALGPKLDGEYLTLDYSKLPAIEGV